jgi:hypothetical protein
VAPKKCQAKKIYDFYGVTLLSEKICKLAFIEEKAASVCVYVKISSVKSRFQTAWPGWRDYDRKGITSEQN